VAATSLGVVVAVTLVHTTGLLASGGETTRLAVLVDGGADPVDAGITADGLVLGVDEDNLEVLVGGVLVDPVGVQDTQVSGAAADTLLSSRLESTLVLELVNSVVGGLAVGGTLGDRALAATAADTGTVDNVTLLGLVTETTGLVGARGARGTVDGVQLAELYYALSAKFNECIARHMNSRKRFSCVPQSFPPNDFWSSHLAIPLKRHILRQRTRCARRRC
jgi:hypothetical protein